MLAQYVSANQKDWDVWIPSVLFAYRTAVHDSTGFSHFKLLFGREPKQPIDFQFPLPSPELVAASPSQHFSALKRTLDSVQEQTKHNLKNAQLTRKAYHDRGVTAEQFAIGDLVLVYNPVPHGSPKFQKHWEGPYLVVSKLASGVTYMLRSTANDKFLTAHRERLKRCLSEPLQEQDVQHVGAGPVTHDVPQPHIPQQLQALHPPINQLAPPPAQPIAHPQANPIGPVPQIVQPLLGLPLQAAAAINPNPFPLQAVPLLPQLGLNDARDAGRPKRQTRPPDRLADQYTPALAMTGKPRRK